MQFILGSPKSVLMAPPEDENWRDAGSYAAVRHPVASVVVCFFLALLFARLITMTGFEIDAERLLKPDAMIAFLLLLLLITLPHELLHAVTFPDRGRSNLSSVGFWPKKLIFYASYLGAHSRNRTILTASFPFVVMTIIPIILAAVFDVAPGLMYSIAVSNGLASAGDLMLVFSLLAFVPRKSDVMVGERIYWRSVG